jgi:dTDP-4-dehydrorhamnose reductase
MRILLTGSEGMLGNDLLKELAGKHEIIPLTFEKADITQKESLDNFLADFSAPDFIIHAAAYTSVDEAENQPAQALAVNQKGTENLVALAEKFHRPLLYLSTDYIFDGRSDRPYLEDDPPAPINQYGLSKLKGEEAVRKLDHFFIVRTAWLYGKNGRNFITTMLNLARKQPRLKVVNDQRGSPTYTKDLARAIVQLLDTASGGIYHLTNSGETTWYWLARKIFEIAGIKVEVEPVTTEEFPRPAPRPRYSVLAHRNWLRLGRGDLRLWETALEDFIINELGY